MDTEMEDNYLKAGEETEETTFEEDNDELNLCVLCCSKIKVNQEKIVEKNDEGDLLLKNLNVIFLLKKVLQVPDPMLRQNLRKCGGNLDNWLVLCDQCNQLSGKAKELHSQMIKIAKQLRNTEQLILDKVKQSLELQLPLRPPNFRKEHENDKQPKMIIWRRTRDLIKTYNYRNLSSLINPFIEGDKLAQKLLEKQQRSTTPTKFEEVPGDLDDLDDYDTVWDGADESNDKLDCKLDSPPTTTINRKPTRLSRRKKTIKKGTTEIIKGPPPKPRLKRNQTAHVKIYGKFKCNFCDKLFSSGGACYNHEREKHAEVKGQFPCDLCPSIFNTETFLDRHKRQSHKVKLDGTPYSYEPKKVYRRIATICTICGKSVQNLQQHCRMVHENKREDFCHVCGAAFKVATNLRKHLLSLHKDDPVTVKMRQDGVIYWRCEVKGCSAAFMHKESLDKHVEKVHGNYLGNAGAEELKSFVCQVCGKGFWKKDKLKRHELIHTKNK